MRVLVRILLAIISLLYGCVGGELRKIFNLLSAQTQGLFFRKESYRIVVNYLSTKY